MSDGFDKNAVLLERASNGDESATELLVKENLGLVKSIALRFVGRGQELEDLIQIGSIGMLKAIRGYDKTFGTAFSTYAVPLITGEIKRFLRDDGLIKVSRETKKNGYILLKARQDFLAKNAVEPSLSVLSELTGIPPEQVLYALEASAPTVSLQDKISAEGDTEIGDMFASDDEIEALTDKIALREAVKQLDTQEQILINLRYFKGLTQSETAKILGMTQVKVSRTEKKIITKLAKQIL